MRVHHNRLKRWVSEMAGMCKPDEIIWIDGSEKQRKSLECEAFQTGELIQLNQSKMPGCIYHRTAINDVARTENLTYICTKNKIDAGPTNNWMRPASAYAKAASIFKNSMKGRKMYVIPFSMGPVGSSFSKIGVELTDSIYVVLNMHIMVRTGEDVLKVLDTEGEFTKCLHGKADLDLNRRLILHFPEDNAIWSVGSGYGGNVLLGKKCLGLRIASYIAGQEAWMAEHMLVLGIEKPDGNIDYIAGAFPSACGKTNLAMLVPPKGLRIKGHRIWTVGDDISWMRVDSDGALWAINPEAGFFGVAPGTNSNTNPNAMKTINKNTIFTNVLLKHDGTVWWEDGDGSPPTSGIDWKGMPWRPGMKDENGKIIKGSHPNARFTAPLSQCPSISHRIGHHHGVPISAILFGGRRAHLAPLIYEAFNWQHGVYVGASMASERTAAQYGKLGEVRRDPMAMLPFCGYNMGDYFQHWLDMGRRMTRHPRIFHVNWFRQDSKGKFLWPGYGENLRVLEWVIDRCNNRVDAIKTPLGYIPRPEDINLTGLDMHEKTLRELLAINTKEWLSDHKDQYGFFRKFGRKMPQGLKKEYVYLRERLQNARGS